MSPPGLHLLLVQNGAELSPGLCQALRAVGHEVETATGPAALAAARLAQPSVVVVDLAQEAATDYALTRSLREQAAWRRPLFVALADAPAPAADQLCLAAGIDLHLTRPLQTEHFLNFLGRFQRLLADSASFDPII